MDENKKFAQLYDDLYKVNFKKKDAENTIMVVNIILAIICAIFFFFGMKFVEYNNDRFLGYLFIGLSGVILIILAIIVRITEKKKKVTYLEMYKEKIVKVIFKEFFPKFEYLFNEGLLNSEIDEITWRKEHCVYESKDLILGDVFAKDNNYLEIKMACVDLANKGKNVNKKNAIFQGVISKVEMHHNVKMKFRIETKDNIEFNSVLVNVNDFEKHFIINSDNRPQLNKILTPEIKLELFDIWNKTSSIFEMEFKNNKLYIRFYTGELFTNRTIRNEQDKKKLKLYYDILKFTQDFSVKLYESINTIK